MSDHYVCEHGSLHRKCELCERDERINELEDQATQRRLEYCQVVSDNIGHRERVAVLEQERDEARKALIWFALEPEIFGGTPNWVQASVIAARAAEGGKDERS